MEAWQSWFHPGESPYYAMYKAGLAGVDIEEVTRLLYSYGVPVRKKDLENYSRGRFNHDSSYRSNPQRSLINPIVPTLSLSASVATKPSRLSEFPLWPCTHEPAEERWFPCDENNAPMQRWGYKDGYAPTLYTRDEALALSKCGYVGQNMLGQRFVVIDIDGVGHGDIDYPVISWGMRYKDITESWENPKKPGSFHLYFWTSRKIPVMHFPYAKLDFMGNATNAAVYTKSKRSNNKPRMFLTEDIWQDLMEYVRSRKLQR